MLLAQFACASGLRESSTRVVTRREKGMEAVSTVNDQSTLTELWDFLARMCEHLMKRDDRALGLHVVQGNTGEKFIRACRFLSKMRTRPTDASFCAISCADRLPSSPNQMAIRKILMCRDMCQIFEEGFIDPNSP